jgi:hypothetical protein
MLFLFQVLFQVLEFMNFYLKFLQQNPLFNNYFYLILPIYNEWLYTISMELLLRCLTGLFILISVGCSQERRYVYPMDQRLELQRIC